MRYIFLLLVCCLSVSYGYSQIEYGQRVDFPHSTFTNIYKISLGTDGMAVLIRGDKGEKGARNFQLVVYDKGLQEKWKHSFFLDGKMIYQTAHVDGDWVHMLFHNSKKGDVYFFSMNTATRETKSHQIKVPKKYYTDDSMFRVADARHVFLPLMSTSTFLSIRKSMLLTVDLDAKTQRYAKEGDDAVYVTRENDEWIATFNYKAGYILKHLTNEGKVRDSLIIMPENDEFLRSTSITRIGDVFYLTGEYEDEKEGFYFVKIEDGEVGKFHYYAFLDFENFFNYLSEEQRAKIEKKKEKKEAKGKTLKTNFRIALHPVFLHNDQLILLGEAYYPTYRTETYYVNGRAQTRTVFDGYQYTHAILAGFDEGGEKLWDNVFRLEPGYKPFFVKRFVSIDADELDMHLFFPKRDNFVYVNIFEDEVKETRELDMTITSETAKVWTSVNEVSVWYPGTYYLSGNQTTKEKGSGKESVYYIQLLNLSY